MFAAQRSTGGLSAGGAASASNPAADSHVWVCDKCGFHQSVSSGVCSSCNFSRPVPYEHWFKNSRNTIFRDHAATFATILCTLRKEITPFGGDAEKLREEHRLTPESNSQLYDQFAEEISARLKHQKFDGNTQPKYWRAAFMMILEDPTPVTYKAPDIGRNTQPIRRKHQVVAAPRTSAQPAATLLASVQNLSLGNSDPVPPYVRKSASFPLPAVYGNPPVVEFYNVKSSTILLRIKPDIQESRYERYLKEVSNTIKKRLGKANPPFKANYEGPAIGTGIPARFLIAQTPNANAAGHSSTVSFPFRFADIIFLPFQTPLEDYFESKVKPECMLRVSDVCRRVATAYPDAKFRLVIDLTRVENYRYDPLLWSQYANEITYVRLNTTEDYLWPHHQPPTNLVATTFHREIESAVCLNKEEIVSVRHSDTALLENALRIAHSCSSTSPRLVIGVHCTHGVDRTGWMIADYLRNFALSNELQPSGAGNTSSLHSLPHPQCVPRIQHHKAKNLFFQHRQVACVPGDMDIHGFASEGLSKPLGKILTASGMEESAVGLSATAPTAGAGKEVAPAAAAASGCSPHQNSSRRASPAPSFAAAADISIERAATGSPQIHFAACAPTFRLSDSDSDSEGSDAGALHDVCERAEPLLYLLAHGNDDEEIHNDAPIGIPATPVPPNSSPFSSPASALIAPASGAVIQAAATPSGPSSAESFATNVQLPGQLPSRCGEPSIGVAALNQYLRDQLTRLKSRLSELHSLNPNLFPQNIKLKGYAEEFMKELLSAQCDESIAVFGESKLGKSTTLNEMNDEFFISEEDYKQTLDSMQQEKEEKTQIDQESRSASQVAVSELVGSEPRFLNPFNRRFVDLPNEAHRLLQAPLKGRMTPGALGRELPFEKKDGIWLDQDAREQFQSGQLFPTRQADTTTAVDTHQLFRPRAGKHQGRNAILTLILHMRQIREVQQALDVLRDEIRRRKQVNDTMESEDESEEMEDEEEEQRQNQDEDSEEDDDAEEHKQQEEKDDMEDEGNPSNRQVSRTTRSTKRRRAFLLQLARACVGLGLRGTIDLDEISESNLTIPECFREWLCYDRVELVPRTGSLATDRETLSNWSRELLCGHYFGLFEEAELVTPVRTLKEGGRFQDVGGVSSADPAKYTNLLHRMKNGRGALVFTNSTGAPFGQDIAQDLLSSTLYHWFRSIQDLMDAGEEIESILSGGFQLMMVLRWTVAFRGSYMDSTYSIHRNIVLVELHTIIEEMIQEKARNGLERDQFRHIAKHFLPLAAAREDRVRFPKPNQFVGDRCGNVHFVCLIGSKSDLSKRTEADRKMTHQGLLRIHEWALHLFSTGHHRRLQKVRNGFLQHLDSQMRNLRLTAGLSRIDPAQKETLQHLLFSYQPPNNQQVFKTLLAFYRGWTKDVMREVGEILGDELTSTDKSQSLESIRKRCVTKSKDPESKRAQQWKTFRENLVKLLDQMKANTGARNFSNPDPRTVVIAHLNRVIFQTLREHATMAYDALSSGFSHVGTAATGAIAPASSGRVEKCIEDLSLQTANGLGLHRDEAAKEELKKHEDKQKKVRKTPRRDGGAAENPVTEEMKGIDSQSPPHLSPGSPLSENSSSSLTLPWDVLKNLLAHLRETFNDGLRVSVRSHFDTMFDLSSKGFSKAYAQKLIEEAIAGGIQSILIWAQESRGTPRMKKDCHSTPEVWATQLAEVDATVRATISKKFAAKIKAILLEVGDDALKSKSRLHNRTFVALKTSFGKYLSKSNQGKDRKNVNQQIDEIDHIRTLIANARAHALVEQPFLENGEAAAAAAARGDGGPAALARPRPLRTSCKSTFNAVGEIVEDWCALLGQDAYRWRFPRSDDSNDEKLCEAVGMQQSEPLTARAVKTKLDRLRIIFAENMALCHRWFSTESNQSNFRRGVPILPPARPEENRRNVLQWLQSWAESDWAQQSGSLLRGIWNRHKDELEKLRNELPVELRTRTLPTPRRSARTGSAAAAAPMPVIHELEWYQVCPWFCWLPLDTRMWEAKLPPDRSNPEHASFLNDKDHEKAVKEVLKAFLAWIRRESLAKNIPHLQFREEQRKTLQSLTCFYGSMCEADRQLELERQEESNRRIMSSKQILRKFEQEQKRAARTNTGNSDAPPAAVESDSKSSKRKREEKKGKEKDLQDQKVSSARASRKAKKSKGSEREPHSPPAAAPAAAAPAAAAPRDDDDPMDLGDPNQENPKPSNQPNKKSRSTK